MEVILDTSFIMICIKEKADFLSAEEYGKMVLTKQVLVELEKLKENGERKERETAELALKIIEKNVFKFEIIELEGKFVDAGIKRYAEGRKVIVATMDKELKRELRGLAGILTLRAKKKIELE